MKAIEILIWPNPSDETLERWNQDPDTYQRMDVKVTTGGAYTYLAFGLSDKKQVRRVIEKWLKKWENFEYDCLECYDCPTCQDTREVSDPMSPIGMARCDECSVDEPYSPPQYP